MIRYSSPNHSVVVNFYGGSKGTSLLESLGFKSEISIEYDFKRKVKQAKLRDFVAKHKAKKAERYGELSIWAGAKEALV